jgi:hypothetical protein
MRVQCVLVCVALQQRRWVVQNNAGLLFSPFHFSLFTFIICVVNENVYYLFAHIWLVCSKHQPPSVHGMVGIFAPSDFSFSFAEATPAFRLFLR